MLYSVIGYYSLVIGLCFGLILILFSVKNFQNSKFDTKILAKHDENYMPPEVKQALGEK